MKKWVLMLILFILVTAIALGAFFLVRLLSPEDSSSVSGEEIETYAAAHWSQYEVSYDEKMQTLSLTKATLLTYDEACRIGGNIYADSTAPETYREAVALIRADLIAQFEGTDIAVELSFLSTDGKPIFTVSSSGKIETCWE